MIVVVSGAARSAKPAAQNGLDHLSGRGLTDTTGHSDHGPRELLAVPGCPHVECTEGILDDQGPASVGGLYGPFGDNARGTPRVSFLGEIGAMAVGSRQSPEDVALLYLAAIDHDAADGHGAVGPIALCTDSGTVDRILEFAESCHSRRECI